MKKKTKYIYALLTQEEWEQIKMAMECREHCLEYNMLSFETTFKKCKNPYSLPYYIVRHFNQKAVKTIEDLAPLIDKQLRKEKRKIGNKSKKR